MSTKAIPARLTLESITTLDKIVAMRGMTRSRFIRELVEGAVAVFEFLYARRMKPKELERDLPQFIRQVCHNHTRVVEQLAAALTEARESQGGKGGDSN